MKTTTKSNASTINTMVETLAGVKPKANPKKDKAPAVIPEFQLVEMGAKIGGAYCAFTSASDALEAVRLEIVATGFKPIDLRTAKSNPEGAKATKVFKQAFIDAVVASGKKPAVAQNYFEIVAKGLTSGKPITSTNPAMAKGNAQKSKGGKGADDGAKMTGALLNVWKLSDVAGDALERIESSMDDGMSLIDAIENELKLQGEDLTDGAES